MVNIFSHPVLYDAAHWWKINDIEFIISWADRMGSPILELAAGTGRLAIPILERGHTYVGLDNSPEFVAWTRKKFQKYEGRGTMVLGDMKKFNFDQKFKFIFIGFNSLFHLYTNRQVLSCFRHVKKHLTATGTFLIDCFVPDPEFLYRDEKKLYEIMEFDHPNGNHYIVQERNKYDPVTQINHIWWYFNIEGRDHPDVYEFNMHMIYPDTMDRLLNEAGLRIREKFGDYDESSFNEKSRLQIYVCMK